MSINLKEIQRAIKFTQVPEVDFKYQRVVSFSQYSTWKKCPYQWHQCKIKKVIPEQPNIHFVFGTAIHSTLEHYFKVMYEQSGTAADKENLEDLFETKFSEEYERYYTQHGSHFSTVEEMKEFFEDGIKTIKWLRKNRNKYFSIKKTHLLGTELPLSIEVKNNVILRSYLDLVLYDEVLNKVKIIDFKTSTQGWKDKEKKDESKYPQLILYKKYFAQQYGINPEIIEIEYIILKRKIWEESEFPQKRIQSFSPSSGKNTQNKLTKSFEAFLNDCFDENGKVIAKEYTKNPSEFNCKYCPLLGTEFCKEGISS